MMMPGAKARGLRPDFCFSKVEHIQIAWLRERGLHGVLLDIDNTITRWERRSVPDGELAWLHAVRDAGISIRLLSNGLPHKLDAVTRQTGIDHVHGRPMKPLPIAFLRGIREMGLNAEEVLMIGDSVFTDVLGANRVGLWTCLVDPLSHVDFLGSKFWRMLEAALRARQPFTAEGEYRQRP